MNERADKKAARATADQVAREANVSRVAVSRAFNPNASLIKGVVCGIRVEDIEHPLMQKIRYLDKLVDELAKGKALAKVLRQPV